MKKKIIKFYIQIRKDVLINISMFCYFQSCYADIYQYAFSDLNVKFNFCFILRSATILSFIVLALFLPFPSRFPLDKADNSSVLDVFSLVRYERYLP